MNTPILAETNHWSIISTYYGFPYLGATVLVLKSYLRRTTSVLLLVSSRTVVVELVTCDIQGRLEGLGGLVNISRGPFLSFVFLLKKVKCNLLCHCFHYFILE